MENFFYDETNFALFKKALKKTKGEPVVINILSTDESLISDSKNTQQANNAPRKNMSAKYEASPFGKFFGPRKKRTTPVDMSNFSSWKNKNYRNVEKDFQSDQSDDFLSFSDFMNKTSKNKFNETDEGKINLQKPINELKSDDPKLKKFSLDSYMHKIEESSKAKTRFSKNEDLLEPLDYKGVVTDSSQDENFADYETSAKGVSFEGLSDGDKYKMDNDELEKVKNRVLKIRAESEGARQKTNENFVSSEGALASSDDFDFEKLGIIDSSENDQESQPVDVFDAGENDLQDAQTSETTQPTSHAGTRKRFFEVNKNEGAKTPFEKLQHKKDSDELSDNKDAEQNTADLDEQSEVLTEGDVSDGSNAEADENAQTIGEMTADDEANQNSQGEVNGSQDNFDVGTDVGGFATSEDFNEVQTDDNNYADYEDIIDETNQNGSNVGYVNTSAEKIKRSDILTKQDFKEMTDEFLTKVSGLYREGSGDNNVNDSVQDVNQYYDEEIERLKNNEEELKTNLLSLMEENKQKDEDNAEIIKQAETEKQQLEDEYKTKIKDIEEDYNRKYEDIKNKLTREKNESERKLEEIQRKLDESNAVNARVVKKAYINDELSKKLKESYDVTNQDMETKLSRSAIKHKVSLIDENGEEEQTETKTKKKTSKKSENIETDSDEQETLAQEEGDSKESKSAKTTKKSTTSTSGATKKSSSKKSAEEDKLDKASKTRRSNSHSHTRTTRRTSQKRKIDKDIVGNINFD